MPLVQSKTCSACGRPFEAVLPLGVDIDDVAAKPSGNPDELNRLFNELLGSFNVGLGSLNAEPKYTSGALFILDIESLPEIGQEQADRRAWVVRYAISPAAAKAGGRFDLRIGKRGRGETELVVQLPAGIRDGTKLRVAGVGPGRSDLLIRIEIRERLLRQGLLGAAVGCCHDCEQRFERAHRAEEARRVKPRAMLPRFGVLIGFGLFALLCLTAWACSR